MQLKKIFRNFCPTDLNSKHTNEGGVQTTKNQKHFLEEKFLNKKNLKLVIKSNVVMDLKFKNDNFNFEDEEN